MFELFDHTADLGIRVRTASLSQLFVEAAQALLATIVLNHDEITSQVKRELEFESDELDLLLFDWLNELLFLYETEHLVFPSFELSVEDEIDIEPKIWRLRSICHGTRINESSHRMHHEVKAITYHELKVVHDNQGWLAELIVDI